jgi:alpha-L-fucosidase
VPGAALVDLELGRFSDLTYSDWITDSTVDDQGAWCYVEAAGFKPVRALVHHLVDNVSKNGYLLLNVGPRADGTIPDAARECLLGIGKWLAVNGEAIYGTSPWMRFGEGPTRMSQGGPFSEVNEVEYSSQDVRFTVKDDALYAICLGWPGERLTIKTLASAPTALNALYEAEIRSVSLLGVEGDLDWHMTADGLVVTCPANPRGEHAFAFKISRQRPF